MNKGLQNNIYYKQEYYIETVKIKHHENISTTTFGACSNTEELIKVLSETILINGNLSIKLISLLLIIFQMKSATKKLKSLKRASWTKSQNGSGEIAAILPSVNSNIWRRYFPANSI